MKTIRAVYENGVFRPLEPVDLPDRTEVNVEPHTADTNRASEMGSVYEVLSRRYRSGSCDTAARHNEHQP